MIMFLAGALGGTVGFVIDGLTGAACVTVGLVVGIIASYIDLPPDVRRVLDRLPGA